MQYVVAADHPSLPGHFPGHPVAPGVLILSFVLDSVADQVRPQWVAGIRRLKFLQPLRPGQLFRVELGAPQAGKLGFKCWSDGLLMAEGQVLLKGQPHPESTNSGG